MSALDFAADVVGGIGPCCLLALLHRSQIWNARQFRASRHNFIHLDSPAKVSICGVEEGRCVATGRCATPYWLWPCGCDSGAGTLVGGSGRKLGAAMVPGCTLKDCCVCCGILEGVPWIDAGFDVGDAAALSGERLISWLSPEAVLLPPCSAGRARPECFLGESSGGGLRSVFSLAEGVPSSGESRALIFIAQTININGTNSSVAVPPAGSLATCPSERLMRLGSLP